MEKVYEYLQHLLLIHGTEGEKPGEGLRRKKKGGEEPISVLRGLGSADQNACGGEKIVKEEARKKKKKGKGENRGQTCFASKSPAFTRLRMGKRRGWGRKKGKKYVPCPLDATRASQWEKIGKSREKENKEGERV